MSQHVESGDTEPKCIFLSLSTDDESTERQVMASNAGDLLECCLLKGALTLWSAFLLCWGGFFFLLASSVFFLLAIKQASVLFFTSYFSLISFLLDFYFQHSEARLPSYRWAASCISNVMPYATDADLLKHVTAQLPVKKCHGTVFSRVISGMNSRALSQCLLCQCKINAMLICQCINLANSYHVVRWKMCGVSHIQHKGIGGGLLSEPACVCLSWSSWRLS